jgi:tRNA threonylcarbamoyladenosine biosynthesis protein TsaE
MVTITLSTETDTAQLAQRMAGVLTPGDTLLLSGEIGAGKSAFARALIRARLGRMEDVPSPTFTLVQTYDDPDGDIWHCDLYRLTHPDEIFELGLDEAFSTAICLIEWPDRLGVDAPKSALHMAFRAGDPEHNVEISISPTWADRLKAVL